MLLDPHERRRFCDYCRMEASSCEAIAKQCEILNMEPVARLNRNKSLAYAIVANDLEAVEDVTIEG